MLFWQHDQIKIQSNYSIGVVTVVKMLIANVNINVNCDFLRKKQIWLHVMFQTASDELKEKILIVVRHM